MITRSENIILEYERLWTIKRLIPVKISEKLAGLVHAKYFGIIMMEDNWKNISCAIRNIQNGLQIFDSNFSLMHWDKKTYRE